MRQRETAMSGVRHVLEAMSGGGADPMLRELIHIPASQSNWQQGSAITQDLA